LQDGTMTIDLKSHSQGCVAAEAQPVYLNPTAVQSQLFILSIAPFAKFIYHSFRHWHQQNGKDL